MIRSWPSSMLGVARMLVAAVMVLGSCGAPEPSSDSTVPRTVEPVPSTRSSAGAVTRPVRGLPAGAGLCEPLAGVRAAYPSARDTTVESEGVEWPARIALLADGSEWLFESSWEDPSRIWRLGTTSATVATRKGFRVGDTVGAVIDAGEQAHVALHEGQLTLELPAEG